MIEKQKREKCKRIHPPEMNFKFRKLGQYKKACGQEKKDAKGANAHLTFPKEGEVQFG